MLNQKHWDTSFIIFPQFLMLFYFQKHRSVSWPFTDGSKVEDSPLFFFSGWKKVPVKMDGCWDSCSRWSSGTKNLNISYVYIYIYQMQLTEVTMFFLVHLEVKSWSVMYISWFPDCRSERSQKHHRKTLIQPSRCEKIMSFFMEQLLVWPVF